MNDAARCVLHRLLGLVSRPTVESLREALASDDLRLIQRESVRPGSHDAGELDCEGACLIGFLGWREAGAVRVWQVDRQFYRLCNDLLRASPTWLPAFPLVTYWDDTPRDEAFAAVLAEVEAYLAQ